MYGFASGDPVTFSDPFGLCTDKNGKERECLVTWLRRSQEGLPDAATQAVAQEIANRADVDLGVWSSARSPETNCSDKKRDPKSLHNCKRAFDVALIGVGGEWIDVGTDNLELNQAALALAIRVTFHATRVPGVAEVLGPAGMFGVSKSGRLSFTWEHQWGRSKIAEYLGHLGHIHVGLHPQ